MMLQCGQPPGRASVFLGFDVVDSFLAEMEEGVEGGKGGGGGGGGGGAPPTAGKSMVAPPARAHTHTHHKHTHTQTHTLTNSHPPDRMCNVVGALDRVVLSMIGGCELVIVTYACARRRHAVTAGHITVNS